MDFGKTDKTLGSDTIWYPAAGGRRNDVGSLNFVGYGDGCWSCTPKVSYAYYLDFATNGVVLPSTSLTRAYGQSVRCLSK